MNARARSQLRYYRTRLRPVEVFALPQPGISAILSFETAAPAQLCLPLAYLTHEKARSLREDLLGQCDYAVDVMREAARLFPPAAFFWVCRSVRAEMMGIAVPREAIREKLKANVLHIATVVAQIVAGWHLDLAVSPGAGARSRARMERIRETCGQTPSCFRMRWEQLQAGMSIYSGNDGLLCELLGDQSLMGALNSARADSPGKSRELLDRRALSLAHDKERTAILVRHLVQSAAEALASAGEAAESDFAAPLLSGSAMASLAASGRVRGVDLGALDSGAECRLHQVAREARRISDAIRPPVAPALTALPDVPFVFAGSRPVSSSAPRRLNLRRTIIESAARGRISLRQKHLPLASWRPPFPDLPEGAPIPSESDKSLGTLVVCVDSSGSTSTVIPGTNSTVLQAIQTAGVSLAMAFKAWSAAGIATPRFASANFSTHTMVSASDLPRAVELNICHSQGANTSLDVPKILDAISDQDGPVTLVIATDGQMDAEATVRALERVDGVHVFEVAVTQNQPLSEFSKQLVARHPNAHAFPVHIDDTASLLGAFHQLVGDLYGLRENFFAGHETESTLGTVVTH